MQRERETHRDKYIKFRIEVFVVRIELIFIVLSAIENNIVSKKCILVTSLDPCAHARVRECVYAFSLYNTLLRSLVFIHRFNSNVRHSKNIIIYVTHCKNFHSNFLNQGCFSPFLKLVRVSLLKKFLFSFFNQTKFNYTKFTKNNFISVYLSIQKQCGLLIFVNVLTVVNWKWHIRACVRVHMQICHFILSAFSTLTFLLNSLKQNKKKLFV